jgi:hypothetical protein
MAQQILEKAWKSINGGSSHLDKFLRDLYSRPLSSYHILRSSALSCAYIEGGAVMESMDLATLIVGVICGIGIIEFIMWIVVVIRHPGYDYLRPDLMEESTPSQAETPDTRLIDAPGSAVGSTEPRW